VVVVDAVGGDAGGVPAEEPAGEVPGAGPVGEVRLPVPPPRLAVAADVDDVGGGRVGRDGEGRFPLAPPAGAGDLLGCLPGAGKGAVTVEVDLYRFHRARDGGQPVRLVLDRLAVGVGLGQPADLLEGDRLRRRVDRLDGDRLFGRPARVQHDGIVRL